MTHLWRSNVRTWRTSLYHSTKTYFNYFPSES